MLNYYPKHLLFRWIVIRIHSDSAHFLEDGKTTFITTYWFVKVSFVKIKHVILILTAGLTITVQKTSIIERYRVQIANFKF